MIKAVLFDLDGVIVDTERHGHRVAFNKAFASMGYHDIHWDERLYHKLLQVGGGKERIRYYFENYYQGVFPPTNMEKFILDIHKEKTQIFVEMLPALPLRPGILRFMRELQQKRVFLGICTTSNETVALTVANKMLSDINFSLIIAGDMVKQKKPDPEIYNLALETLKIKPVECLVIEDSHIGVTAAKQAGCFVLATYNGYTADEDLSQADFIVSCLGDENGETAIVRKQPFTVAKDGVVRSSIVEMLPQR